MECLRRALLVMFVMSACEGSNVDRQKPATPSAQPASSMFDQWRGTWSVDALCAMDGKDSAFKTKLEEGCRTGVAEAFEDIEQGQPKLYSPVGQNLGNGGCARTKRMEFLSSEAPKRLGFHVVSYSVGGCTETGQDFVDRSHRKGYEHVTSQYIAMTDKQDAWNQLMADADAAVAHISHRAVCCSREEEQERKAAMQRALARSRAKPDGQLGDVFLPKPSRIPKPAAAITAASPKTSTHSLYPWSD